MPESFAPTILTRDGRTITPRSYEWVIGFAIAGVQWAIDKLNEPGYMDIVRNDLKARQIEALEQANKQALHLIEKRIREIEVLRGIGDE